MGVCKKSCCKKNTKFSLSEVELLAHKALDSFDMNTWKKYVDHVIKIEDKYLAAADYTPFQIDT